jgi:hypothetical protein
MIDTESLTRSPTAPGPINFSAEWLANIAVHERPVIGRRRPDRQAAEPDLVHVLGGSTVVVETESGATISLGDILSLASNFKKADWLSLYYQHHFPGLAAESTTEPTERSLRQLFRAERRDRLLQRLSPERRATYERIRRLREEIGPIDFDVVEALRELRENG